MQSARLAGRSILIVEDEPLIAVDIMDAFQKVGAIALTARTVADAIRFVEIDQAIYEARRHILLLCDQKREEKRARELRLSSGCGDGGII